jgi:hypothetical protein
MIPIDLIDIDTIQIDLIRTSTIRCAACSTDLSSTIQQQGSPP